MLPFIQPLMRSFERFTYWCCTYVPFVRFAVVGFPVGVFAVESPTVYAADSTTIYDRTRFVDTTSHVFFDWEPSVSHRVRVANFTTFVNGVFPCQ